MGHLGYCLEPNTSSSSTSSFLNPSVCLGVGNPKGRSRCLVCFYFGSYFIEPCAIINSFVWPDTSATISPQLACSYDDVGHFGWSNNWGIMGIAYKYNWISLNSHFINLNFPSFEFTLLPLVAEVASKGVRLLTWLEVHHLPSFALIHLCFLYSFI